MVERLIGAQRIDVMVRVPLEVEEQDIGHHCAAVPAVRRPHPFVAAAGQLLTAQPVVLYVVDRLEQAETGDRLPGQPWQHDGAEPYRKYGE